METTKRNTIKTRFASIPELMHTFAQRTHAEGRSSNVFFYMDKIYSYGYHYLLAEFKENNKGELFIIINDKGYSVSTSKHISQITGATRQYEQFFATNTEPKTVYNYLDTQLNKLAKARKPEIYINNILNKIDNFNEYISFNPDEKKRIEYRDYIKKIKNIHKTVLSIAEGGDTLQKIQDAEKKRKASELREQKAKERKLTKSFLDHKINNCVLKYDILRLSNCGNYVQTSQGVTINKNDAKALYLAIKAGKNVVNQQISHYLITSIDDKFLKVGCHTIEIKEIDRIGQTL